LHGDTYQAKREKKSALIRDKVAEMYALHESSPYLVLPQDSYLFTRKDLATRLKGDDDSLLCWLRTVEVAMNTLERHQSRARSHSEKFFAPFLRLLGQQKQALRAAQQEERRLSVGHSQRRQEHETAASPQSWPPEKEISQLEDEVSPYTAQLYRVRSAGERDNFDGLERTILGDIWGSDGASHVHPDESVLTTDSSIASPSCFFRPIVEQEFSSDGSSYCPSKQRDVALLYDSETSGSRSRRILSEVYEGMSFSGALRS